MSAQGFNTRGNRRIVASSAEHCESLHNVLRKKTPVGRIFRNCYLPPHGSRRLKDGQSGLMASKLSRSARRLSPTVKVPRSATFRYDRDSAFTMAPTDRHRMIRKREIASMGIDLVATLSDLVRLPSVNPMGRPVSGDIYFEHRMTEYLQELFQQLGVPWTRQAVAPQRENIVARLDGDTSPERGGPLLMLEAHQDTVPVDGMTIPPFTPTITEGKLYGRGSCDIKGGMASMLWAFAKLAEERPANRPTVLMACSVNEEHGFYGARELAQLWQHPELGAVIPRRPDAVIVAEPTLLNVVVAHKGTVRWRCRTSGGRPTARGQNSATTRSITWPGC